MIAFAFTLPYHVLRTAAATGMCIHVLGNGASRGLRMSRYCRAYHETQFGGDADALLAEIGELARRHAIEIVFPSDDVSTRLLAAFRDRLPIRSTPLPDLATFDLLNDKWNFTRFCGQNGVRAPQGWLFDNATDLRRALDSGKIALPITAKPTNRSGGVGVLHIREPAEAALIDAIDYRPVLVQRHIRGASVSITILCERGRVIANVAQERDSARFRVLANADLLDNATRLATLTGYHGPANLDAVLSEEDGRSYLVECNPRFWYSIYLVMISGLNFIDLALSPLSASREAATLDSGEIRLPLRDTLTRPWRASRLDWKYIWYSLGDPIAYLLQRSKSYGDSEVAVPVGQMTASDPINSPIAPGQRRRAVRPSFTAKPHSAEAIRVR
ncbi:MAG TPA: ATP-grasp domain-containing protein [Stellaceae bacterium]|nr:ATP-grasp domain-containing protein [Stellaceae bacterium]